MRHIFALGFVVSASLFLRASELRGGERDAASILKELNATTLPLPPLFGFKNEDAKKKYQDRVDAIDAKRAELILELYRADPAQERIPHFLSERWQTMIRLKRDGGDLAREITQVMGETKSEPLQIDASYYLAELRLNRDDKPLDAIPTEVESFVKRAPGDIRTMLILSRTSIRMTNEPEGRLRMLKQFVEKFPQSIPGMNAERELKSIAFIGKPFELEFNDAISGKRMTMKDLRGKVVVIDFWATWCGPCVGEMPNMKKLYQKYHDQGVEFIGVSLDVAEKEGGLKDLKEFVSKNEIAWPQYYQGNGWESEFSVKWGITSIPTMFVVDSSGVVRSTTARGRLDEILPDLIKQSKADSAAIPVKK